MSTKRSKCIVFSFSRLNLGKYLRTNCVYCDTLEYQFSMSQNKLCVLWRTRVPILHVSEQTVYCDTLHYYFPTSQQQMSPSSSKYYKRKKQSKLGCRLSTYTSENSLSVLLHGQCSNISSASVQNSQRIWTQLQETVIWPQVFAYGEYILKYILKYTKLCNIYLPFLHDFNQIRNV
jgi:hypothetical protein